MPAMQDTTAARALAGPQPAPPQADPLAFFRLRPIRAARVSEVSETTAAAPVPPEERINFHIGNPLQDTRLSSAFLRAALGIDVRQAELRDADPEAILRHLGWQDSARPALDFLIRTIQKSSPYMPRGGYYREKPHALIRAFCSWLEHQQEALPYDTGEQSGRREIILSSGGIQEALRVLLFALSSYLEIRPARILCYRHAVLPALRAIPNLVFEDLAGDEPAARRQIEQILAERPPMPTFLLIGAPLGEETRRRLRLWSTEHPLMFIEANNTPNHLSLAREARLEQRVIRLLTPAIFAPHWAALSLVFIAGNADILRVIENVHFNLKGTPSASEIELLSFLLERAAASGSESDPAQAGDPPEVPPGKPSSEGFALGPVETALPRMVERIRSAA